MAKKKGNGSGTIFYDADKKLWRGQVTLGTNYNGKLVRKSVSGKTKTEARRKLNELIASGINLNLKSHNLYVGEWMSHWLETYKKPELRENSYSALKRMLDLHIIPTWGNVKLSEFDRETVQLGYNRLFGDRNKYSQSFARKIANILSQGMKIAILEKLIDSNPTVGATLPKVRPPRVVKPMTRDEQRIMVKKWESEHKYNLFIFMLATGMRIGETLGMTYDYLDLDKKEYKIERQMIEVSGNARFQDYLKTDHSVRTIYLNDKAVECLEKQIAANEPELNFKNLIWPTSNYTLRGTANIRRMLKRTFEEEGVSHYPLHALRHTYATRMVENGVNIKFLQKSLGHKNIETTLQIYSEALGEFQRQQADEISVFD